MSVKLFVCLYTMHHGHLLYIHLLVAINPLDYYNSRLVGFCFWDKERLTKPLIKANTMYNAPSDKDSNSKLANFSHKIFSIFHFTGICVYTCIVYV